MSVGPDFICVGQGKAGTAWLYDQVQRHPDFWMPPIKELHYLDTQFGGGSIKRILDRRKNEPEKEAELRSIMGMRPVDDRDLEFYGEVERLSGRPLDLNEYCRLFRYKGALRSGDITPAYSGVSDETIRLLADSLRDVRIVVLIRDPVERMWSQVCMAYRNMERHRARIEDPQQMAAWVSRVFAGHAYATRIVGRWREHFAERLSWYFYDDLVARPEWLRNEILVAIGGDPTKPSGVPPEHNWKQGNAKLEMSRDHLKLLVAMFREELIACAEMFGGHATGWPKRYGL